MTGRSIPEWIGRDADEPVPPRVRVRIFDKWNGRCDECKRKIVAEPWTCDHKIALINGGENRERNLRPLCDWCNPLKNADDLAEKSKVAMTRQKHVLGRPKSRWFNSFKQRA